MLTGHSRNVDMREVKRLDQILFDIKDAAVWPRTFCVAHINTLTLDIMKLSIFKLCVQSSVCIYRPYLKTIRCC